MHRALLLLGSIAFCAAAAVAQRGPVSQSPEAMRAALAEALFRGFPGNSGETIEVEVNP